MKLFLELIKIRLKINFHYKWSFLLCLLYDPLILIVQISVLKTIYTYNETNNVLGYSIIQMIWYFAGVKLCHYLIWSYPDQVLSDDIIYGILGLKLLKPFSVLFLEFANTSANNFYNFLFIFIPNILVFSAIVFPEFLTIDAILKFLILSFFASILFYLTSFLFGITAIKFQNLKAVSAVKIIFMSIASGAILPLDFFPRGIQKILAVLPFRYLSYVPVQFFLNLPHTRTWDKLFTVIGIQMFWIVILYFICKASWSFLIKYHTIAGG